MGTVSAIAQGSSRSLIERAADVTLKERRKLILVPRETPLGLIQLRNMTAVTEAGAIVMPAMPGFYHHPESIQDLVDMVAGRVLHGQHLLMRDFIADSDSNVVAGARKCLCDGVDHRLRRSMRVVTVRHPVEFDKDGIASGCWITSKVQI